MTNGEREKSWGPVYVDDDGDVWGVSLEADDSAYDWITKAYPDYAMCGGF
jgi:hypothetical protein